MRKSGLLTVVLCLCLVLALMPWASAEQAADGIDGILAYETDKASVDSLQAWIDGELSARAGVDAEWYVIALAQYGENLDFERYADSLEDYLRTRRVASASTRQKYALALVAAGRENTAFVRDTLADSIGAQGIMSVVFGLHLLNTGLTSPDHTSDALAAELLTYQLSDGGFAVSGEAGNADVTAMVLQALAPHREDEAVAAVMERALDCLCAMQQPDGSFVSYGVSNAESCAQVLIALCALGIDPYADARFIQNGSTVVDALLRFRTVEGAYSHEAGGAASVSATSQTLCAFVALERHGRAEPSLYLFEEVNYDPSRIPDADETAPTDPESEPSGGLDYRFWVSAGIVLAALAIGLFLLARGGRGARGRVLALLVGAAVLCVLVCLVRVQTPEQYYGDSAPHGEPVGTVTLEIRCDAIVGADDRVPADGVLLAKQEYTLYEGDTVYDVLVRATKQAQMALGAEGVGDARYVSGIAQIYEFDHGDRSGWTYAVGEVYPPLGCAAYRPTDGDSILFVYTTTLGDVRGD